MILTLTPEGDRPRIDPALIPDYAYDEACRVLNASIRRALADPELRRDYEEFKAAYRAAHPVT